MKFERENRYAVMKVRDFIDFAPPSVKDALDLVMRWQACHRNFAGKEPFECVVVEKDWPEYEATWRLIEERVEREKVELNTARGGE